MMGEKPAKFSDATKQAIKRLGGVAIIGWLLWWAYDVATSEAIAAALGTGTLWLGYLLTGLILFAIFAAATQLLFASFDKLLQWIHPDFFRPWFRWPKAIIFVVMLGCAATVALALNTSLVHWVEKALIDAATATLGEASADKGIIGSTLAWIKTQLTNLLSPYFAISKWLQSYGGQSVDHWAQPLAFAAGLQAWYFKRHDDANRLGVVAKPSSHVAMNPPPARKRIIIHCDGTSNSPRQKDGDVEVPTNVYRLHQAVTRFDANLLPQISIYDAGVGTDTSRQSNTARRIKAIAEFIGAKRVAGQAQQFSKLRSLLELATGAGISENIEQGYREIVRIYEPGDEIWLFGFSRGAYTARCIAGVIARCGLLKAENIRFVPDAITLYLRRGKNEKDLLAKDLVHGCEVKIKFMGLWDTVGSLGLPLWGWWFRVGAFGQNQGFNNVPADICQHVYHALSIDETRSQFMPTLTEPSAAKRAEPGKQVIEQVWFRGGHAEVGGGYAEHELADLALDWMVKKAEFHNLGVDQVRLKLSTIDKKSTIDPQLHPFAPIKTAAMRNPRWALFGTWPRWHPAERPDMEQGANARARYGTLGDCVRARSNAAKECVQDQLDLTGLASIDDRAASDGFVFLDEGQSAVVTIHADRIWNRTGLVFEQGASYEISHADGKWRDKDSRPCGAGGDELAGLDLFRRLGAWARRSPRAKYCALFGHVAHPRPWPVLEFGFFKLIGFFVIRDPWPLRASLIGIGEMLESNMTKVSIHLHCPSGVFYAFANDLWTTYANNSGLVAIKITRIAPDGAPDFTITERGEVKEGAATADKGDKEWQRADARIL